MEYFKKRVFEYSVDNYKCERSHWNIQNIQPKDPVTLGLCSQRELDAMVAKAAKRAGLTDEAYVEIVSIVSTVMGIDSFCDALGMPLIPLPAAQPGEPSRYRPAEAKDEGAWVATIPSDGTGENEAALYGEGKHPPKFVPNVFRAMSLVPDAVRNLRELLSAYYVKDVGNLSLHNSLDRRQIELVAARVSSINECFY